MFWNTTVTIGKDIMSALSFIITWLFWLTEQVKGNTNSKSLKQAIGWVNVTSLGSRFNGQLVPKFSIINEEAGSLNPAGMLMFKAIGDACRIMKFEINAALHWGEDIAATFNWEFSWKLIYF